MIQGGKVDGLKYVVEDINVKLNVRVKSRGEGSNVIFGISHGFSPGQCLCPTFDMFKM